MSSVITDRSARTLSQGHSAGKNIDEMKAEISDLMGEINSKSTNIYNAEPSNIYKSKLSENNNRKTTQIDPTSSKMDNNLKPTTLDQQTMMAYMEEEKNRPRNESLREYEVYDSGEEKANGIYEKAKTTYAGANMYLNSTGCALTKQEGLKGATGWVLGALEGQRPLYGVCTEDLSIPLIGWQTFKGKLPLPKLRYMTDEQYVIKLKNEGNHLLMKNMINKAIDKYTEGLSHPSLTDDIHSILLSNRAEAHIRMDKWSDAEKDCFAALKIIDKSSKIYIKTLSRYCLASKEQNKFEEAEKYLGILLMLDPAHSTSRRMLHDISIAKTLQTKIKHTQKGKVTSSDFYVVEAMKASAALEEAGNKPLTTTFHLLLLKAKMKTSMGYLEKTKESYKVVQNSLRASGHVKYVTSVFFNRLFLLLKKNNNVNKDQRIDTKRIEEIDEKLSVKREEIDETNKPKKEKEKNISKKEQKKTSKQEEKNTSKKEETNTSEKEDENIKVEKMSTILDQTNEQFYSTIKTTVITFFEYVEKLIYRNTSNIFYLLCGESTLISSMLDLLHQHPDREIMERCLITLNVVLDISVCSQAEFICYKSIISFLNTLFDTKRSTVTRLLFHLSIRNDRINKHIIGLMVKLMHINIAGQIDIGDILFPEDKRSPEDPFCAEKEDSDREEVESSNMNKDKSQENRTKQINDNNNNPNNHNNRHDNSNDNNNNNKEHINTLINNMLKYCTTLKHIKYKYAYKILQSKELVIYRIQLDKLTDNLGHILSYTRLSQIVKFSGLDQMFAIIYWLKLGKESYQFLFVVRNYCNIIKFIDNVIVQQEHLIAFNVEIDKYPTDKGVDNSEKYTQKETSINTEKRKSIVTDTDKQPETRDKKDETKDENKIEQIIENQEIEKNQEIQKNQKIKKNQEIPKIREINENGEINKNEKIKKNGGINKNKDNNENEEMKKNEKIIENDRNENIQNYNETQKTAQIRFHYLSEIPPQDTENITVLLNFVVDGIEYLGCKKEQEEFIESLSIDELYEPSIEEMDYGDFVFPEPKDTDPMNDIGDEEEKKNDKKEEKKNDKKEDAKIDEKEDIKNNEKEDITNNEKEDIKNNEKLDEIETKDVKDESNNYEEMKKNNNEKEKAELEENIKDEELKIFEKYENKCRKLSRQKSKNLDYRNNNNVTNIDNNRNMTNIDMNNYDNNLYIKIIKHYINNIVKNDYIFKLLPLFHAPFDIARLIIIWISQISYYNSIIPEYISRLGSARIFIGLRFPMKQPVRHFLQDSLAYSDSLCPYYVQILGLSSQYKIDNLIQGQEKDGIRKICEYMKYPAASPSHIIYVINTLNKILLEDTQLAAYLDISYFEDIIAPFWRSNTFGNAKSAAEMLLIQLLKCDDFHGRLRTHFKDKGEEPRLDALITELKEVTKMREENKKV